MTEDELTQANKDDIALVAKHEDKAMGFMMFKVSEQELLDARNAVIKRMFELREPSIISDLRDAARAVCDSCQDQFSDDYSIRHFTVDEDKINELRKLLPKEPQ